MGRVSKFFTYLDPETVMAMAMVKAAITITAKA